MKIPGFFFPWEGATMLWKIPENIWFVPRRHVVIYNTLCVYGVDKTVLIGEL